MWTQINNLRSPYSVYRWLLFLTLIGGQAACTKMDFGSILSSKLDDDPTVFGCDPVTKVCGVSSSPTPSPHPTQIIDPSDPPDPKKGIFEFATAINRDYVWVVTRKSPNNYVFQIKLNENDGTVLKKWTMPNADQLGSRTYVTSVGLFIGKRGGKIYRVDETIPETTSLTPIWTAPNPWVETRMCLTSFTIGAKAYLGIGWENASGQRAFTRMPLVANDPAFPDRIDAKNAETKILGTGSWSYGCYTDQSRKFFWGAWGSGKIAGINFETLEQLDPKLHAPNSSHLNSTLGSKWQLDPGAGSNGNYALAGDARGNILTGTSIYTYAHETRTGVVLGTQKSSTRLLVADPECYFKEKTCDNKIFEADLGPVGHIAPLSSLNDGRIVGIARSSAESNVYVLKLKEPGNISKLVTATRVASVEGDAYMYNDFTGFSLYAAELDLTVEIDNLVGFNPDLKVKTLSFVWQAQGGGSSKWEGLTMEARCYKKTGTPGAFEKVEPIRDSGEITLIGAKSCQDALMDRLDLRVRPTVAGSAQFTRTSKIQVFGTQ